MHEYDDNNFDEDDEQDSYGTGFVDPTQVFGNDPNYNHAIQKSRYLQVDALPKVVEYIDNARLYPATKRKMKLFAQTLLDSSVVLANRSEDEIDDLRLVHEIMYAKEKGSFHPSDVRGDDVHFIHDIINDLNENIVTRSKNGMERDLQNRTEQVITQYNHLSQETAEQQQKKRGFAFWRR
jgi:hypothetical protein